MPGAEVNVLLRSVGSRGRAGSRVKGGYQEREGCRKYGEQEGPGEVTTGAGSLGPVDPDGAGQEGCREEWIQMSGEWAGSKGGCSMVCCNNLQNCTEGEWSGGVLGLVEQLLVVPSNLEGVFWSRKDWQGRGGQGGG